MLRRLDTTQLRSWPMAVFLSGLAHLLVGIFFCWWSWNTLVAAPLRAIDSTWSPNPAIEEILEERPLVKVETEFQSATPFTSGGSEVSRIFAPPKRTLSDLHEHRAPEVAMFSENFVPLLTTAELAMKVEYPLGDLQTLLVLGGMGSGDLGDLKGNGDGSFFGGGATAGDVVYVVDASRSMNHPHHSEAGTRFGCVKIELLKSILGLQPTQRFQIIYFNHDFIQMPAKKMLPRNSILLEKQLKWAARYQADGQTDPRGALMKAISFSPDVIYFLTDGRIKQQDALEVTRFNQNRVAINTVCISESQSEDLMRNLASANRGKYTFVE